MITFRIIKDPLECKKVWNKLSSKKNLWDEWDFRHCFYDSEPEYFFIVGYKEGKECGLVPLVYVKDSGEYLYFGDLFPEQNKFFLKDKKDLPFFLEQCPYETSIYYIDPKETEFCKLDEAEKRYFLDLKKYDNDIENYLKTFTKKHRKNLRYDLRKLKEKGYVIEKGKIEDFKQLIKFNKQTFEEDSDFNDEDFVESIKKLIQIAKKKNILDIISVTIDKKAQAVGIGVIYKNSYFVIAMGRNIDIANVGKMLIFEQIKTALEKNCDSIDFLSTESGWKELWNLDSELMYEFHN